MTVAVFSDIHGNHLALEACVQEAVRRGVKRFLFLGDYISDFANPQKTMELLRELDRRYCCRFLRGNREEYTTGYRASGAVGWKDGSGSGALLYTYENLTEADLNWFETLDFRGSIRRDEWFPGNPPLAYCHGSFRKSNGRLLPEDPETLEMLSEIEASMALCGHAHTQAAYRVDGPHGLGKRVVNPGSVGQPNGVARKAQMALLSVDGDRWQEEFLAVPYDAEAAVRELEEAGLFDRAPVWTQLVRHELWTGENKFDQVLNRARELCRLDTEKAEWPDIPEQYWEQAAAETGLG